MYVVGFDKGCGSFVTRREYVTANKGIRPAGSYPNRISTYYSIATLDAALH
jgi:hypothetical protein